MTLRDLIEGKLPTVGMVKKTIKSLDLQIIHPEFFDVQKRNSDAGMGGYNYIQITFDKQDFKKQKYASDIKLVLFALQTKYKAVLKDSYLTIE